MPGCRNSHATAHVSRQDLINARLSKAYDSLRIVSFILRRLQYAREVCILNPLVNHRPAKRRAS